MLRTKWPFSVRMAWFLVFLLTLANLWRTVGLYRQRPILNEYGTSFNIPLLTFLSALWTVVFIILTFQLWRRWRPARWLVPVCIGAYAFFQLLLPTPPVPLLYWHIFLILFTAWALNRPKNNPQPT